MAERENTTLSPIDVPEDVPGIRGWLKSFREDFESHNHDGINSKRFLTLLAETISARTYAVRKTSFTSTLAGLWMGIVGSTMKFVLGDANNYIKWDGTNLTIKAALSNLQIYQAVVDASGNGDYLTVAAALAASKTRIFVRNGTYNNEPQWSIGTANTIIEGESYGGVAIDFATGDPNVALSAANISFNNLKLVAYHTSSQTLIKFNSGAVRPIFTNCIFINQNGKVFDGSGAGTALFGTFQNIYIDSTTIDNQTNYRTFYSMENCVFFNCIVDFGSIGGVITTVDTCSKCNFYTCSFLKTGASDIVIATSATSTFVSCKFEISGLTGTANFDTCYFHNNTGGAISTFFITLSTIQTRLNNCTVDIGGATGQPLYLNAANIQCNNNYIIGGLQIYLQHASLTLNAISFCNNTWLTTYTAAAADITIAASVNNSLVVGNIVRAAGSGHTPTVTNGGTGNTVANNILTAA